MNYYEAKFEREKKEDPCNWIIIENGKGHFRLVFLPIPERGFSNVERRL